MPRAQRVDPPYVQVMNHYRRQIQDGELSEGDRLPPVEQIGREWGISRATAARAVGQLQIEGYLRTSPQGTFVETLKPVADTPRDRMARVRNRGVLRSESEMEIVRVAEMIRVPVYVAELMGLDPAGQVIRREWVTVAGRRPLAEPVQLSVAWFDPSLAEAVPELLSTDSAAGGSMVHRIERTTGRRATHGEDHMHGRAADEREAAALGLSVGTPILAAAYLWVDQDGGVIEYGEFCLPPRRTTRYEYEIDSDTEDV
jgi:GntR family transcriptional regulator